ncbi:NAD(P)-dependent dehydrogenase (short-subunit alcohol dehydrogenase family) [Chitinophaga niastensis]|uniref:NAD(P)-dependent dehydrogenase (Short-subunit alcohol dehydrogenase family) n=1 Tax=Chitinophaga niastensis TaxID=536980 RepID=A0A2P8HMR2_CHINA|nr:SDR family oxidoreductase [Chitinophaga niastensis]PSL47518.1 NAD(P)-dependent dehydrogenase (short-subunit alcohol dehydrogenase family) [Chitinophaga niastensis]
MQHTKIALITGANRGLGLETARQLLQKGIQVIVSSRDADKGQEAVRQLQQEGLTPVFLPLDISDARQVENAHDWIAAKYGQLDILINNAAITGERAGRISNTLLDTDVQQFKNIFDVNVWGTIQLTQALLPLLRKSAQGRIINLSSELGSLQLHADSNSPLYHIKKFGYNSSKTMVNLFTIYLQEALQDTNITANVISPGWVKTDMGTQHAYLEVPEGAAIITRTALEEVPVGSFFTHDNKLIPW